VDRLLDAASVQPDNRVLDLASGPGHVAAAGCQEGEPRRSASISRTIDGQARAAAPSRVAFRQCEAEKLPFPEAWFDAVVTNFLINHMAAPEAAVAEELRVLRPRVRHLLFGTALIGLGSWA
jgi:ubiquinone/menaquinone biosynthesis C-methylase UbiE